MASVAVQSIPKSALPIIVRNTFIDMEDEAFEVDPRRSSSEPPSTRHSDRESPPDFGFKCRKSSDFAESTASGLSSRKGSFCDSTSEDGSPKASGPEGFFSDSTSSDGSPKADVSRPSSPVVFWADVTDENTAEGSFSDSASSDGSPKADVSLPMSPVPQKKLNPDAAVFKMPNQLPLLSLELSVLAMIPRLFQSQFQDLFKTAEQELSQIKLVKSAKSVEASGLWGKGVTIVGTMCPKDAIKGKAEVLKSMQQVLLQSAEKSKSIYVMGYELMPFTPTEHGFAAMLAGIRNTDFACGELLTQGFCQHGARCARQHPSCMVPIYIEIEQEK